MATDDDNDDFEAREKALEDLWRADFRRAAESLHDIGAAAAAPPHPFSSIGL
jgi:hypothetical protein